MSSKHFPGLPPYVDAGLAARAIPEDVRGGLRSAWPARRVEDQLAALATIEAIPGDQSAALQDAFNHAVVLIDGQAVMLAGQVEAASLMAAAYGLDGSRLEEIERALRDDVDDASPAATTMREMYIAKAKELEARLDEAAGAREAAETRAKLAENAAAKAREQNAYLAEQVANLRAKIATREAEAARVKAGFEKALAEAKEQVAEASKPQGAEVHEAEPSDAPEGTRIVTLKRRADAPIFPNLREDAATSEAEGPPAADGREEPPAIESTEDAAPSEAPADQAAAPREDEAPTASKAAKPGRKAR